jgi:hypothetical protein
LKTGFAARCRRCNLSEKSVIENQHCALTVFFFWATQALPAEWQSRWWEGIPTAWDEDCPGHLHMFSQLRGFALIKALDMIYYANDMDNNLGW